MDILPHFIHTAAQWGRQKTKLRLREMKTLANSTQLEHNRAKIQAQAV